MTTTGARGDQRARRSTLLTIMALGTVVTLAGVSGVFAVFTDRATTGTNSASSREEAASADLQIAAASLNTSTGASTCGTFSDHLATGIITATDLAPFGAGVQASVCLKNAGSQTADVTAMAIDLLDTDTDCTGDENNVDGTCGADEEGELSGNLDVTLYVGDCSSFGTIAGSSMLSVLSSTPQALGSVPSGDVVCVYVEAMNKATGDDIALAQTDTATWRFAFDATAV